MAMATAVSAAEMAMENRAEEVPFQLRRKKETVKYRKVDIRSIQYQLN